MAAAPCKQHAVRIVRCCDMQASMPGLHLVRYTVYKPCMDVYTVTTHQPTPNPDQASKPYLLFRSLMQASVSVLSISSMISALLRRIWSASVSLTMPYVSSTIAISRLTNTIRTSTE